MEREKIATIHVSKDNQTILCVDAQGFIITDADLEIKRVGGVGAFELPLEWTRRVALDVKWPIDGARVVCDWSLFRVKVHNERRVAWIPEQDEKATTEIRSQPES